MTQAPTAAARYETIDVIGVRTPAFPASVLAELYESPNLLQRLHDVVRDRQDLRDVIRVASPLLADAVDAWLSHEPEDDERVVVALLSYIARSTMRATPFGLCAAVGFSRFDSAPEPLTVVPGSEFRPRSRVDAGWLHALALKVEGSPAFSRLRVVTAGTAIPMHGRLSVCDPARTEARAVGKDVKIASIPSALNLTPSVALAIDAARNPIVVQKLAELIERERGVTNDAAFNLIRRLVALGVLITELRAPMTGDPAAHFVRALRTADPQAAGNVERVVETLRGTDTRGLAGICDGLREATGLAEQLVASEHYYLVDCAREYRGTLSTTIGRRLEQTFARLVRLAAPFPRNEAIAGAFARRYNDGREVPLLRLLDSEEGLAFEEALNDRARVKRERYDARALELAMEAIADRRDAIELDGLGLEALNEHNPEYSLAPAYETLCYLIRDASGEPAPCVSGGFREGAGRSLARFGDMLGAPIVANLLRSGAGESDAVDAELSYLPHWRRSANITIRPNPFDYEIVYGVASGVAADRTITLDDIVVGVDRQRVYLRSQRLRKRLHVRASHLLNASGNSRVAHFLTAVGSSDYPVVAFDWGGPASGLPYRPRVLSKGTVVSLATWSLPNAIAANLEDDASKNWLRRWRVSRFVYLAQWDNRVLLDLANALCRRVIEIAAARKAAKDSPIQLEEPLPFFSDGCVAGARGAYIAELAVSLKAKAPSPNQVQPQRPSHEIVSAKAFLRPPGSEWVDARCYIGPTRAAYFLETAISRIVADLEGSFAEMHFLQYADPDFHVRIRFRSASGKFEPALLNHVVSLLGSLVDEGKLERVEFATYDREIERYGGTRAIALAETFFTVDSRYVLSILRDLRVATDKAACIVTDLVGMLLAMFAGPEEAVAWGKRKLGRHGRLAAENWHAVRLTSTLVGEGWPQYQQHRDAAARLMAEVAEQERDAVIRSLVHMHCNRLGMSLEVERETLYCALAAIEGHQRRGSHRAGRPRRGETNGGV
jgi:thiopeptide-type bacteriocin biosynthesis protein